jgi:hypothetical protein
MIDRSLVFNMRIGEDERAKLAKLAEDEGMTCSVLVRRWIKQRYEARFGDAKPAARGKR